jgi:hypothetical protein
LQKADHLKKLSEKSTMRLSQRLIAATVLIALSGALAGCGGGGISSWDPSDMLDWLDTKKKLEGNRKPVFPEGVPGLEQGVPRDLYKGSAQEQINQQNAQAAAAAAPPPEEPKQAAKKGKRNKPPAAASTADPNAAPDANASGEAAGDTAAAPPAPKPKKIVRKRTTAPPPDQQDAQPASGAQPAATTAQQQSAAPFPAPMPSNTFSH